MRAELGESSPPRLDQAEDDERQRIESSSERGTEEKRRENKGHRRIREEKRKVWKLEEEQEWRKAMVGNEYVRALGMKAVALQGITVLEDEERHKDYNNTFTWSAPYEVAGRIGYLIRR
jgi:hypothetical protein